MRIKNVIPIILILITGISAAIAQEKSTGNNSPEEMNKVMLKLFNYYESYEDGSAEAQKQAKFDKAFDALTRGSANAKDKNDAYKIVDAYIKADQNPLGKNEPNTYQNDLIKNSDEYKRFEEVFNESFNQLINMPYPDFEETILKLHPTTGRREIQETYNQMHSKDGKYVSVTAADDEMTPQQQTMWALKIIENPKNYDEFAKAAKILNPKVSDSKLRTGWEKYKSK